MSALGRAECPICRQSVPVRRNGALREHSRYEITALVTLLARAEEAMHRVYLPQLGQDPTTHLGRTRVCEGSGSIAGDAR